MIKNIEEKIPDELIEWHKAVADMVTERYFYSKYRLECIKNKHDYTECADPDCPFGYCDTCKVDYMSISDLGTAQSYKIIED